jgi:WD40 repeat protein
MRPARTLEESAEILSSLDRVLAQENHNLSRRPELTWQQLYNRLQWKETAGDLLETEWTRRRSRGTPVWFRMRTPFRESAERARTLEGHTGSVNACALSPDGSLIVSGSSDSTLKVWETNTGLELRTITGHEGQVWACAFSADGSFVVSGGEDGLLRIWDARSGEGIRTIPSGGAISGCAVSPDGSLVASGGGRLILWDTQRGSAFSPVGSGPVVACAFSPNGSRLVSTSRSGEFDGRLTLWNTRGESLLAVSNVFGVNACAFSPDGSMIVSSYAFFVGMWDSGTGAELRSVGGHSGAVLGCAVSPEGSLIGTASDDRTLKLWDVESLEELGTLEGHGDWVRACAFSPDGSQLVSASKDQTLKLWDVRPITEEMRSLNPGGLQPTREAKPLAAYGGNVPGMPDKMGRGAGVWACEFIRDGNRIASADPETGLKVWATETGEELSTLDGRYIEGLAVSPDGSYLADTNLSMWDPNSGHELRKLEGHSRLVAACAVSLDGSLLVSVNDGGIVEAWDAESGERRLSFETGIQDIRERTGSSERPWGRSPRIVVTPDGSSIVVASGDPAMRIWDLQTGEERCALEGHTDMVLGCAVSPDGSVAVSASDDSALKVWDMRSGAGLRTLDGHSELVTACCVSPDGSCVVSVSDDRTLRAWEIRSGHEVAVLPLVIPTTALALHPTKPLAACGDEGHSLYLADLEGIEYGPIVVTAIERDGQRTVRCPRCWQNHAVVEASLGQVIDCPTLACDLTLRVNPFIVKAPLLRSR